MDSGNILESLKYYLYPFSWKKPLLYIVFFISFCLYVLLFYTNQENVTFGIIETDKTYKLFSSFVLSFFLSAILRSTHFIKSIQSLFFRYLLLLAFIFIAILVLMRAWPFAKYDNQRVETYWQVFPFPNSSIIKINTLEYKNIKSLKKSMDQNTLYILDNGRSQGIKITRMSHGAGDLFFINLSNECDWLKDDIESIYGSIEKMKLRTERNEEYNKQFNIITAIECSLLIWAILVQLACVFVYAIKRK